jgi:hypothetical protein
MTDTDQPTASKPLLHQFRSAPVALVVQAEVDEEAADALKELQGEAETVSQLLFGAGYDVHLLSSGKYSEVTELLKDADIRERLVILHYCGHANGNLVQLKSEDGSRLDVPAEALAAQMASETSALRLVYLNACLTDAQAEAFRIAFPSVNFIGTKIELPDWYARKFAESFYNRFLGPEADFGQVRIRHALETAAGEDMGRVPERVDVVFRMTFKEGTKSESAIAELPDLNFRADEGRGFVSRYVLSHHRRRSPETVLIYAAAIIAIQFVFMWCASGWTATSSPAFQAAFSYAPDCATIVDMHERLRETLHESYDAEAFGESAACDEAEGRFPGQLSSNYGVFVEWSRSILLSIILVFLCAVVFRRLPRDYPFVFTSETWRWLRLPQIRKYLVLFAIGVVSIVAYHTTVAHEQLSQTNITSGLLGDVTWLQARWPVYAATPEIWHEFETLINDRDKLLELETGFPQLSKGDDLYHELYVRPYLYYMGYSLVNYLGTALPVLVVIANGLSFGALRIKQRLAGLRLIVRRTLDGYYDDGTAAERRLDEVRGEMSGQFVRFVATFAVLTLFAGYEMLIGKTTTAFFAQIVMYLVFLLVLVGAAKIFYVWNSYRDEIGRISELVNSIDDSITYRRLRRFEKSLKSSYTPTSWPTMIAALLAFAFFAYLIIILFQGNHWTAFTHDFPFFF